MLSSYDDFPIHQATVPIAHTATADLNHYDRYFFNGYRADGDLYFALAMGLYPNRHVVDAAFSVVQRRSHQISVFASARAPLDRRDATTVGPLHVEVIEPLRTLRLAVDAPEHGLRADLRFDHRSAPLEEPPFLLRAGTRTVLDFTRLTQFGTWSGWIEVDGERVDVDPAAVHGSRDRSWGIRPVGEPAPSGAPAASRPQYFWLWAPVNFPSLSTHFDVNEYADGRRWHDTGAVVPIGGEPRFMRSVDYRVEWRPGTRWAMNFAYDLVERDGGVSTVSLEPVVDFQMRGLGYGHPEWGHGRWKGESVVGGDRLTLPVDTPCAPEHLHVQTLCRATFTAVDGTMEKGTGILEQMVIGEHFPTGLTGTFDPAG